MSNPLSLEERIKKLEEITAGLMSLLEPQTKIVNENLKLNLAMSTVLVNLREMNVSILQLIAGNPAFGDDEWREELLSPLRKESFRLDQIAAGMEAAKAKLPSLPPSALPSGDSPPV